MGTTESTGDASPWREAYNEWAEGALLDHDDHARWQDSLHAAYVTRDEMIAAWAADKAEVEAAWAPGGVEYERARLRWIAERAVSLQERMYGGAEDVA